MVLGLFRYDIGYTIAARLAACLPNFTARIAGAYTANINVTERKEREGIECGVTVIALITVFTVAVLSIEKCFILVLLLYCSLIIIYKCES